MPRGKGKTEILEATEEKIVLKGKIGKDYKFTIPKQLRSLIDEEAEKLIIIENP